MLEIDVSPVSSKLCRLEEVFLEGPWKLLRYDSFRGELKGENFLVSKKYAPSVYSSEDDEDSFLDNEALRSQVSGEVGLLLLLLRL